MLHKKEQRERNSLPVQKKKDSKSSRNEVKLKVGEGGGSWCFGAAGEGRAGREEMRQVQGGPRTAAGQAG